MARQLRMVLIFCGLIACAIIVRGSYQPLPAQIETANLGETLLNSPARVAPATQIVLRSAAQNTSRQTSTDAAGRYEISSILPGIYNLV